MRQKNGSCAAPATDRRSSGSSGDAGRVRATPPAPACGHIARPVASLHLHGFTRVLWPSSLLGGYSLGGSPAPAL